MNELAIENLRRGGSNGFMTAKEIASVLNLDVRTIQIKAKELFPNKVVPREESRFNEVEVTAIKNACEKKFAVETQEDKKHILKRAFEILNDENEELRKKVAIDAPKVESYDAFMSSEGWMTMNDAGHSLNIGRNALFAILRDKKILMKDNLPYQMYMDRGYFKVIIKPVRIGEKVENKPQTLVGPKGLEYIKGVLDANA